jgi:hypothetical protein
MLESIRAVSDCSKQLSHQITVKSTVKSNCFPSFRRLPVKNEVNSAAMAHSAIKGEITCIEYSYCSRTAVFGEINDRKSI